MEEGAAMAVVELVMRSGPVQMPGLQHLKRLGALQQPEMYYVSPAFIMMTGIMMDEKPEPQQVH